MYDVETQLYYLQSRYYDPEWGRFINADSFVATGQGFVGNNMFAYCLNNPVNRIDVTGAWPSWNDIKNGFQKVVDWAEEQYRKVEAFVAETIDYFTIPSEDEHFSRNEKNIDAPAVYDEEYFKDGWDDNVSANCHQFSAPNHDNKKYVSDDGYYEVIYDINGMRVDDPRDIGTYNFVSPNSDPIGHFIKDVLPWFEYGNSPEDDTKKEQRILAFIGIYY